MGIALRTSKFHRRRAAGRLRLAFAASVALMLLVTAASGAARKLLPPDPPTRLASPDGRLILSVAITNFDGSAGCLVYGVTRDGRMAIAPSKLGLTFGDKMLREHLRILNGTTSSSDTTWQPVCGERRSIRDHYNQLVLNLQETRAPHRRLQLTFRAYNEGAAFCYTIPLQARNTSVSNLTEQTEFRFTGDHPAWSTTTAQGDYSATPISRIPTGCERPLTVQVDSNLFLALGEARLVDYARMKFAPLVGTPTSLVTSLSGTVTNPLPLTTPWRFILIAETPGQLLENNSLVPNLNDPCALADTSWIQPGKVFREVSLTTAGGRACVDFARKHGLQYIEFDAGWYGVETTSRDATRVKLDPARSAGPLDLQAVIDYGKAHGIGVILYVNQVALTAQIDILPALYRSWGVKGIKFGFVNVGSQSDTAWLHAAVRQCATNQLMVDVHDEARPTGYTRTYPNLMTLEGISGDEAMPSAAQDTTLLFTRMLAGPADHTVCYFDPRVTNQWSYAYQLAKAVCFYSPWQFLYWYDRPTNATHFVAGGNDMISEVPELEFYDHLPTTWDETRVLAGAIGQYAIIARRKGDEWFVGAMNSGSTRTFSFALNFLPTAQPYLASVYSDNPILATRTQVQVDRVPVEATATLSLTLDASRGIAMHLHPAVPPVGSGTGNPAPTVGDFDANKPSWKSASITSVALAVTNQPRRVYQFSMP